MFCMRSGGIRQSGGAFPTSRWFISRKGNRGGDFQGRCFKRFDLLIVGEPDKEERKVIITAQTPIFDNRISVSGCTHRSRVLDSGNAFEA
jgi:hypothetical protein